MMRIIEIIICAIISLPTIATAATNPECLKHLGGAFADVECYNGLSNDITQENRSLINQINATIPPGNKNKKILKEYEQEQSKLKKYCSLSRDSLNAWESVEHTANPRYYYYDVEYYKCVYENLKYENKFLKELLANFHKSNDP